MGEAVNNKDYPPYLGCKESKSEMSTTILTGKFKDINELFQVVTVSLQQEFTSSFKIQTKNSVGTHVCCNPTKKLNATKF